MRDDLTEPQLAALQKLGYRSPADKRRDRRAAALVSTVKWTAIVLGSILALKACQFVQGYHGAPDDEMSCGHRGCE